MLEWLTIDEIHRLRPDVARTTIWRWAKRWAAAGDIRVEERVRSCGGRELVVSRADVMKRWGLEDTQQLAA